MLRQFPTTRIEAYGIEEIQSVHITKCEYPTQTSIPEFGCTLSHLHALHMGINTNSNTNTEWFVVLEDDVLFDNPVDFGRIVERAHEQNVEWDIIQTFSNNPGVVASLWQQVYQETQRCFHPWEFKHYGTGSYIIKRSAAQKILQRYGVRVDPATGRICAVDFSGHNHKMVSDLILYQNVKTWTVTFPVHRTLDEDSHIHETHLDMHRQSNSYSLGIQQMYRSPFTHPRVLGIALNSGLGNRFFQLAAAYGIAKTLGRECLIAAICEDQAHGIKVNHFQYLTNRFHAHTLFKPVELPAMVLTLRLPETPQGKGNRMRVIRESQKFARDDSAIRSAAASVDDFPVLFGFWQCEEYFFEYRDAIRELFREPDYIQTYIQRQYSAMDLGQVYFLHVRLGDFCNAVNRSVHFVDLSNYYARAMDYVRAKDPEARFLVFCEEPEKVATVYPCLKDFPVHREPRDLVNFYLMTRCKGGICANSTYSWWAAWLLRVGSLVCIPRRWFPESNRELCGVTVGMRGAVVIG